MRGHPLHKYQEVGKLRFQNKSVDKRSRLKVSKSQIQFEIHELNNLKTIPSGIYLHTHNSMLNDISDTVTNPKLRTYKNFKTEGRTEPYLNLGLRKPVYRSIVRFRLSSHNLQIELDRHKHPYVQGRR